MQSSQTPHSSSVDENRLTAEVYDEFLDALDLLYIRANLSGRLKFLENWPVAAHHIFGDELIGFDHHGTTDTERRSVLEAEAEERRVELLEIVKTLEAKSVEKSVLQTEYVESVVTKLGYNLSLLLYAPKIIHRFIPEDQIEAAKAEKAEQVEGVVQSKPKQDDIADEYAAEIPQKSAMRELDDDNLDSIQPISTDEPPSSAAPPMPDDTPPLESPPSEQSVESTIEATHPAEKPPVPEELTPPMEPRGADNDDATPEELDQGSMASAPSPDDIPMQEPPIESLQSPKTQKPWENPQDASQLHSPDPITQPPEPTQSSQGETTPAEHNEEAAPAAQAPQPPVPESGHRQDTSQSTSDSTISEESVQSPETQKPWADPQDFQSSQSSQPQASEGKPQAAQPIEQPPASVSAPSAPHNPATPSDADPVPTMPVEEPRQQPEPQEQVQPESQMPRQQPPPSDPTAHDVTQQSKHKALGDGEPIASQKMTFVPAKNPASPPEEKKSPGIPVIGGNKDRDKPEE